MSDNSGSCQSEAELVLEAWAREFERRYGPIVVSPLRFAEWLSALTVHDLARNYYRQDRLEGAVPR